MKEGGGNWRNVLVGWRKVKDKAPPLPSPEKGIFVGVFWVVFVVVFEVVCVIALEVVFVIDVGLIIAIVILMC